MAASLQSESPKRRNSIVAALLLAGAASIVAQVVLLRELLGVFEGNEFSLGIMLAVWLLATSAGSGVLGRLLAASNHHRQVVAGLQVASAVLLPLAILLVRCSRVLMAALPGEVLGPERMLLVSVLALGIYAPISGIIFAVASRWWSQEKESSAAAATSAAYMLETLGAAGGGLLASLVLLPWLSSLHIAALLGTAQIISAIWFLFPRRTAMALSLAVLVCSFGTLPFIERWNVASLALQWPGLRLVETVTSRYGVLAVIEANGARSLAQSGAILFTAGDTEAAEEAVHLALLQHAAPRTVLLVGGGVKGSALQVMRHPSVERLDYVELDPRILGIAAQRFPAEWAGVARDSRIQPHSLDGRAFLRGSPQRFDAIILDLPSPRTAQWNRFYTREFFDDAAAALNPGGIFGFQLRGAENFLNPQSAAFFQCIQQTMRRSFREVKVIPGDTLYFLGSNGPGRLQADAGLLERRVQERRLGTAYVRDYFLAFRLAAERQFDLSALISPSSATPVNRDFAPVAYYLETSAWATQFDPSFAKVLDSFARLRFRTVLVIVLLGSVLSAGFMLTLSLPGRTGVASCLCTGAMGMTMLVLELFLLLGFQALYGYVFHQFAIIIAGFMLGMAVGTWGARRRALSQSSIHAMIWMQVAAAALPLLLWAVLIALAGIRDARLLAVIAHAGFPLVAALCGAIGGLQFPFASAVFFRSQNSRNAGALYAFDLLGSCLGALVAALFLLPLFGFGRSAALLGTLNLCVALLAFIGARRQDPDLRTSAQ